MTAPWGQQDGEGEIATGSLGREVCVPRNSASPFPRLPGLATLKDRAWACEARPDV